MGKISGKWTINPAYPWQVLDGCGILACSCENDETAQGIVDVIEAAKAMLSIINESHGIVGWHLNGDVLRWEQCEPAQELEAALT